MWSGVMGRKSWEDWTGWRVIGTFQFILSWRMWDKKGEMGRHHFQFLC